jgi:homoserine O-acetyltransferase/O-succinyltransferase
VTILGTPRAPDERTDKRSPEEPGDRKFKRVFETDPLSLDLGGSLGPITVAYESWGTPSPARNNAILIEHALTGDSHAAGDMGPGHPTPGWWDSLIGPGAAIDTDHWWVICPNTLGGCRGTTGPCSPSPDGAPWGSRFPTVTVRDQVAVEAALTDVLGIERWAAIVGGSMGGMRALEWAVMYPDQVERLIVLACGAAATAEQIALCSVQSEAIRLDPDFHGGDYYGVPPGQGPERGLSLARRIGHVTYRSELELNDRFGRQPQPGEDPFASGRYAVESYLDHQAEKLVRRFDANSYLVLSRAMDHHDLGRDRGGAETALATVRAATTVAGVDSDRLYPLRLQLELATMLPGRPHVEVVNSPHGHDGFLVEQQQVTRVIEQALGDSTKD